MRLVPAENGDRPPAHETSTAQRQDLTTQAPTYCVHCYGLAFVTKKLDADEVAAHMKHKSVVQPAIPEMDRRADRWSRRHHIEEVGDENVCPDENSLREKSLQFGGRVDEWDGYSYNDYF